jgi:cytidylate kinase
MPLITISRGIGCGGEDIAKLVADGLKVELFDDLKLQQEAMEMGIKPEELNDLDEKAPGFFDLVFSKKPEIYLDYMESIVYEVAKKGEGVIIGHGSQMLLRDFECALHVHVYASEPARVQNLVKQKGINENAALKLIRKNDNEQKGFLRFAFHMDWNDPSLYDLIINTDKTGMDLTAKTIQEVALSGQMQACSLTALEAMEKLSLKKRIHAAILKNDISLLNLNVEVPEAGIVELSGFTHLAESKDQILKTIKEVSGVTEVKGDVAVIRATI